MLKLARRPNYQLRLGYLDDILTYKAFGIRGVLIIELGAPIDGTSRYGDEDN